MVHLSEKQVKQTRVEGAESDGFKQKGGGGGYGSAGQYQPVVLVKLMIRFPRPPAWWFEWWFRSMDGVRRRWCTHWKHTEMEI